MTTALQPINLDKEGAPMIRTIEDAFRMAEMMFQSGLVPSGYKNAQAILVAWEYGRELGLSRMQSLYNIGVVNGRPSIYGKALPGIVISKGVLENFKEWFEGEGENLTAIVTVKRKNFADEATKRFSVADARKAGLMGKDTYQKYPKDMILYKARARAFSALFADVLCGLPVYEDYAEVLQVDKNERVESSQQAPVEEIDDPLMKQIGATEVPAEKPKRAKKEKTPSVEEQSGGKVVMVAEVVQDKFESKPDSEESALAAENANALGVPPEDIPPVESEESVRGPNNVSKPEPKVFACKSCQDTKLNSKKTAPCPICAPKKFDVVQKDEAHKYPKPLKNQSKEPSAPPIQSLEVTFEKPPVALGKGNFKFVTDENEMFYSNAPAVKTVVDANMGDKIHIGVQEIDSRMIIVSARQIV